MTVKEFNEKYAEKGYHITEVEDYDPECDDYRYAMTKTYNDWTHPEAAFDTIEEAEKYIAYIEEKEEKWKNIDF